MPPAGLTFVCAARAAAAQTRRRGRLKGMAETLSISEDITAQLRAEISSLDEDVDRWASMKQMDLAALEAQHEEESTELANTRRLLEKQRDALIERTKDNAEARARHEREVETLSAAIHRLKAETEGLPEKLTALAAAEEAEAARLDELRLSVTDAKELREQEHNDLTRGVLFYKRLGLDFERALNDRLRLTFTKLDPAEPERPFSFCVHVDDDQIYHISGCEPALPMESVAPMLRKLNEVNNFGAFVCGMRRCFEQLVK